jgi:hypothetical protein
MRRGTGLVTVVVSGLIWLHGAAAMAALHSTEPAPPLGRLTVVEELPEGIGASSPPLSVKFCKAVAFVHKFSSAMM